MQKTHIETGIYSVVCVAENRQITRVYINKQCDDVEVVIVNVLQKYNDYYKTMYQRKDISIVKDEPDSVIQLAETKQFVIRLQRENEHLTSENTRLAKELCVVKEKLKGICLSVFKGPSEVALETLEKVNQELLCRNVMNPNEPVVQLSQNEKNNVMKGFTLQPQ